MALPTPNYQFFTTENVLYDAISGTDKLAHNHATNRAASVVIAHPNGNNVTGINIPDLGVSVNNNGAAPVGDRPFVYSTVDGDVVIPTQLHTVSFWVRGVSSAANAFYIYTNHIINTSNSKNGLRLIPSVSRVRFENWGAGSPAITLSDTYVTPTNLYFCTVVRSSGVTKIYVDGVYKAQATITISSGTSQLIFGAHRNNTSGTVQDIYDFRTYDSGFTDEQVTALYDSYFGKPQPTTPTSLIVTPTYLYPTSTISATGSGSDGDEYHYEFYDTTDSVLLQDYSVTNTYSLNQELRNHNIRISVKGYTSDADPPYSEALSTTKLVYTPKQKITFGTGSVDIIWGP
jgi:hypothetical protein